MSGRHTTIQCSGSVICYNYVMKGLKLGTNFAVFVLFFGVATLDAVQTQNWLRVAFWVVIGAVFLWADRERN